MLEERVSGERDRVSGVGGWRERVEWSGGRRREREGGVEREGAEVGREGLFVGAGMKREEGELRWVQGLRRADRLPASFHVGR